MYTIYADGDLLYSPTLAHEGRGVVSPRLTVEINKAGSLEYTLPPNNVKYNTVNKLKSIITAFQNDDEIFRGRVLSDEKDFYKQKKTYCEGELAFFLDSIQRPYSVTNNTVADLFKRYINNHNSRVEESKRFTVGKVTVEGTITCKNNNYPTTIDEINEQIINTVGGRLSIRVSGGVRYIDLLADDENEDKIYAAQTIEFGSNLLDITEHITAENVFTVIVPLGAEIDEKKDAEGNIIPAHKLTIADVNDGKDYIENATGINLFGRIERCVEWSDVENPATLKNIAIKELNNSIKMAVSLTVTAVDLHLLRVDAQRIKIGEWVRVISIPHELDEYFKCTKIVYDMENPENSEYSFGITTTSLTDQLKNVKQKK